MNKLKNIFHKKKENKKITYEDITIDLIVEKEDNNLLISTKDYASGLPDKVKE